MRSEPLPLLGPHTAMLPSRRSCRWLTGQATRRSPSSTAGRWPHTLRAYTTLVRLCQRREWFTDHYLHLGPSPGYCLNCTVNQELFLQLWNYSSIRSYYFALGRMDYSPIGSNGCSPPLQVFSVPVPSLGMLAFPTSLLYL